MTVRRLSSYGAGRVATLTGIATGRVLVLVPLMAGILALLVPAATATHNSFSHSSLGARKGNGPFDPFFRGASADGAKVFFETMEQLTNDDTDRAGDVYQRANGVTTLISKGQISGNGEIQAIFRAASTDGSRVFFETNENLTSDDTDTASDVYQRSGGVTTRVSKGQINGSGAIDAMFGGITPDGSVVFFTSAERLTSDDSDSQFDAYKRTGNVTERISKSSMGGNGAYDAFFAGTSADASRVFFTTPEKLSQFDGDDGFDVYERSAGKTTLVSTGLLGGIDEFPLAFIAASADGTHVFFLTTEQLTPDDNDNQAIDIYERFAGATTLVTKQTDSDMFEPNFVARSADGTRVFFTTQEAVTDDDGDSFTDVFEYSGGAVTKVSQGEPSTDDDLTEAVFCGISTDGTRVFFATGDPLTSDDTNGLYDVYERAAGVTTRISRSPTEIGGTNGAFCGGSSADGSHVFFTTDVLLTVDDMDESRDVYEGFAGSTKLISKGNGAFDASFNGASANGATAVYSTPEQVMVDDADDRFDLYQHSGATTSRLSDGEPKGNGPFSASASGSSSDGGRLFFTSAEQLTNDDTDASVDLFQRSGTTTTRLSTGPINGQGSHDVAFRAASGDGTKVFFTTNEQLTSEDPDLLADVYQRSGATTTLVSRGEPPEFGEFVYDAVFAGVSADGTKAVFTSLEQLTLDDFDFNVDLFLWSSGSPLAVKISKGPWGGDGAYDVAYRGMSTTGGKVFFTTAEQLVSEDTDAAVDVYEWSGGLTTRISQGLAGGNGGSDATFAGISADGGRVFFTTAEKLTYDDLDNVADLYQRSGTTTVRISQGAGSGNGAFSASFAGTGGTHVFFTTAEPMTADDSDTQVDIYDRSGNTTTRVSRGAINGNGAFVPTFARASTTGSRVFFTTAEKLTSDDTDAVVDIYRRESGVTTRISQGQVGGSGAFPVTFRGISADGSRVFFTSDEVLTGDDGDGKTDVYERFGGATYRVSSGNGPSPASYRVVSADGKRLFFETAEKLAGTDVDGASDIYSAVAP